MKATIAFIVVIFFAPPLTYGQKLTKEYQKIVLNFIESVRNDRKEVIAGMISYPFEREYPIPIIKNKKEFIKRYNEVFDDTLKRMISTSNASTDWSDMGWRGIMLNDGVIWLDFDGRLIGVNYQSVFERNTKDRIIKYQKSVLHPSVAYFERPVHILKTSKHKIRIDDLGNANYRYASWPLSKTMRDKPDLIIHKGNMIPDGSGGNHSYTFKNGEYVYECSIIVIGEKTSPPAMLTIYKGKTVILSQKAKIMQE